ncbi:MULTISPECIES: MoaD/ThiS family protein [Pseudomonas]|uniref:MoaD/ThiS family protein n=1 Tax=Pseudomonas quercus TaxID=2722792 RepID=A0ABX0YCF8_9PSED|nr:MULTISPECIES: MoaD/ThiS family protein [Pseudomonas]MBF7142540.1 MoaD/ThiS family protein [Pseudomonas sp. LY10J]NJP01078.1 MoaD/ThiS family protein [Pseudomonas quercus]
MTRIIIASQLSDLTNGRKSWTLTCSNAQQLLDGLWMGEPLLFSAIVQSEYRLKPFVSLVIDDIPYSDEERWQDIPLTADSTALIITAVAGG